MLCCVFTIMTSVLVKSKSHETKRKVKSMKVPHITMSFAKVISTEVEAYFQLLFDYNATDDMLVNKSSGRYYRTSIWSGWANNLNNIIKLCHLHTCSE